MLVSCRAAGQVPGKGVAVGRDVDVGDGRSSHSELAEEEAESKRMSCSSSSALLCELAVVAVWISAGQGRGSGSACASWNSSCCELLSDLGDMAASSKSSRALWYSSVCDEA
jgi:hypothetical protein